jgi:F-type H+-transporting ATPase subunit delta
MEVKRSWQGQSRLMAKRFSQVIFSKRAQRLAKIETAVALSGNLKARVRDDLIRIYGPALRISFVLSPALIGGMRITVGSDLYDGSVRGTLATLEGAFRD